MAKVVTDKEIFPLEFVEHAGGDRSLSFSKRPNGQFWVTSEAPVDDPDAPVFTQAELEVLVDSYGHDPDWEPTLSREQLVEQKMRDALAAVRQELANWPVDLNAGSTLADTKARVNQLAAQERRTTQRLEKIIQMMLRTYDVAE